MRLYIGNKKYSSWSFRPWIAMQAKGIEFEEVLIPFNNDAVNPKYKEFSPTSKVPALIDRDISIWESMAILEYLAEAFPKNNLWPEDKKARAHARAISNEMATGMFGIRGECPMNMAREISAIKVSDAVKKDVSRIEAIWDECLSTYGGPFLFGEFTIADAMFAPVVNRIEKYELSSHSAVIAYLKTMKALAAYKAWEDAGAAEAQVVEADEA